MIGLEIKVLVENDSKMYLNKPSIKFDWLTLSSTIVKFYFDLLDEIPYVSSYFYILLTISGAPGNAIIMMVH